jgi:hypothetical protein
VSLAQPIERLEPTARAYLENQFFTKRYADLKQQIGHLLYGVLSLPPTDLLYLCPPVANRILGPFEPWAREFCFWHFVRQGGSIQDKAVTAAGSSASEVA